MKHMRWAIAVVATFALVSGTIFAQDMDVRALQAKLAQQEARLNDLQAKMNSGAGSATADNLLSNKKNARVTIGGEISVRGIHHYGTVKQDEAYLEAKKIDAPKTSVEKIKDVRTQDFRVHNAKVDFTAKVGDNFEAYILVDLQSSGNTASDNAQKAYLHWKNICNSGFGVLVGRNSVVFGADHGAGSNFSGFIGGSGADSATHSGVTGGYPAHIGWDYDRTTQITPYWQSQSGAFKAELSYMQSFQTQKNVGNYERPGNSYRKYRTINDGVGTGSLRLTWKPIEGLKLVGSYINLHNNNTYYNDDDSGYWIPATSGHVITKEWDATKDTTLWSKQGVAYKGSKNNNAVNLHINYIPCFLPQLMVWATYQHEWNAGFVKDATVGIFNFGARYMATQKLGIYAIGEIMRSKSKQAAFEAGNYKSKAWAMDIGATYDFGSGFTAKIGWRHEDLKWENKRGYKHTKAKDDVIYTRLNFNF